MTSMSLTGLAAFAAVMGSRAFVIVQAKAERSISMLERSFGTLDDTAFQTLLRDDVVVLAFDGTRDARAAYDRLRHGMRTGASHVESTITLVSINGDIETVSTRD